MSRWRRFALVLLLLAGLGSAAAAGYLYTPDIDSAVLEARYGKPPSQFIAIDGARVHVRDQGPRDAPAIVLVHGLGGSLQVWQPWTEALSARYRVISLDLPGHGLTGPWARADYSIEAYADLVGRLVTALGIDRFAIAGHSMGGMVAWWGAASAWPSRVTGLILVDASGYPGEGTPRIGLSIARLPLLGEAYTWLRPPYLTERALRRTFADPAGVGEEFVRTHLDLARRSGNRTALLKRLREFVPPDAKTIRLVRAHTLIMWGADDRIVGIADGRRFNRKISGSRLIVYERAGHNPMWEQAAASAADAMSFLDSVASR
jgi:pimeloyl-ACP methyl ester carboxylesterase